MCVLIVYTLYAYIYIPVPVCVQGIYINVQVAHTLQDKRYYVRGTMYEYYVCTSMYKYVLCMSRSTYLYEEVHNVHRTYRYRLYIDVLVRCTMYDEL